MERIKKNYLLADVPVSMTLHYPYTLNLCKDYEVDSPEFIPQIEVEADEAKMEKERSKCGGLYRDSYLESLAVYRELCEKMLSYDTFLFHGSAVAVDGEAYLFGAPSGTGKSTHVRLWVERFGERAVVINDDKPLIQVREEAIFVCGTPWSGKHSLNSNQKAPLKAVCILERGTENDIEALSPLDAYPSLFKQTYRPEDRPKMIKTLALLKQFAERIPMYRLHCDISQEAVSVSWGKMSGSARQ